MASWLLPALKAVLPHVGSILDVAMPVFTRKSTAAAANQAQLMQEQIAELQAAATQNAEHVKALAAELQATLRALQEAAAIADARMRRALILCAIALAASGISLAAAAFMLITK
ncbi:MAG: hypothetical protein ACREU5_08865 [Burkholderiales bacterium]